MEKIIKILIVFFFSHKFFFEWIINHYPKNIHQHFLFSNTNVAQLQSMISRRWEFQDLFADSIIVT